MITHFKGFVYGVDEVLCRYKAMSCYRRMIVQPSRCWGLSILQPILKMVRPGVLECHSEIVVSNGRGWSHS